MAFLKRSSTTNFDYLKKDITMSVLEEEIKSQELSLMKLESVNRLYKIENNQIVNNENKFCLLYERNFWLGKYIEAKKRLTELEKKFSCNLNETVIRKNLLKSFHILYLMTGGYFFG